MDMRVTPTESTDAVEAMIKGWCEKAGADVTYEFVQKNMDKTLTCVNRAESPYWAAIESAFDEE